MLNVSIDTLLESRSTQNKRCAILFGRVYLLAASNKQGINLLSAKEFPSTSSKRGPSLASKSRCSCFSIKDVLAWSPLVRDQSAGMRMYQVSCQTVLSLCHLRLLGLLPVAGSDVMYLYVSSLKRCYFAGLT